MKCWPENQFVIASPSVDSHGRTRCVHGHSGFHFQGEQSLFSFEGTESNFSDQSCCCRLQGDDGPEPEEEGEEEVEVEEDEKSAEDEESAEVEEQEQVVSADGERWPRWLRPLLSARFYTSCKTHPGLRRGVRSSFCLDCAAAGAGPVALCSLCADQGHRGHHVIRVRRSTYSSVLRASDVRGLLDVDGVQTYVINGDRSATSYSLSMM